MRTRFGLLVLAVVAVAFAGEAVLDDLEEKLPVVWLDELDVKLSECGWERTRSKKSVGGNPLRAGGQVYDRGIGTHPPGVFVINLAGGSKRFTGLAALDEEVGRSGSVEFIIEADGKRLWTSGILRGGEPPKAIGLDVTGVKLLKLTVTTAGDGYGNDHADWLDAKFHIVGAKPEAHTPPPPSAWDLAERELADGRGWSKSLAEQTFRPDALYFPEDKDALDVVLRRTSALLARLKTMRGVRDLAAEETALTALKAQAEKVDTKDTEARKRLLDEATKLRRKIAFANPLLGFDRILFAKKHYYPGGEGTGNHMCDQYFGFMAIHEGGIFVLENPFGDKPVARDLLANAVCENGRFEGKKLEGGGFLFPDLSYDGTTILFPWTEGENTRYKWTPKSTYHIFKVNADGTGLRQLTDGAWNDLHPCWLPNGRICFMSERRGGYGRCHGRPVPTYTLHTMNADGSDITCISYHETNEWHPSVNHDGMIVYTRWDYVDRGFNQAHHPWITTPDGRDARAIQGNWARSQGDRPLMEMNVHAIPGSRCYVATAAAHHGQAYGSLIIVDPNAPDDDKMEPVKRLTPEVRFPEAEGGQVGYATAWPLSEEFHLCVYDPQGTTTRGSHLQNRYGIYLVDAFGNKELLYRDPDISCLGPIPLRPRPRPPVVAHGTLVGKPQPAAASSSTVAATEAPANSERGGKPDLGALQTGGARTAPVGVVNVYDGLLPWPAGTRIAALRIIQVLPKSTPSADGPRIGYGGQKNARAVLGTVPVEKDGSAYFELPVCKPVFFQALDEGGLAVQSMRSDVYVQPGETLTCQGCHDPRGSRRSLGEIALAMTRPPSVIQPDAEGSNPFSYPRLVQPVLDKHCVACHAKDPKAKGCDLAAGEWQKNPNHWYTSYRSLEKFAFFYGGVGWETPRTIPGQFGARGSKLYALLAKGHYDVKLPPEDLHRIVLWLDCNSDFFGAYEKTQEQAAGEIVHPSLE
ncbi:MAG TPA: NPCBM/NEW2 domain-containing protein [Planctomycetota bacterium]|nr:NPCBM/NEW2 domain-containing protein [Planctomycetota bacterium]